MFSGQSQHNGQFSGTYNPDQGGHSHQPNGPQVPGLPTVIDSNLSLVVMGGLVAYSIYTKYFQKKDYDGDGTFESCPVSNEPLNFN